MAARLGVELNKRKKTQKNNNKLNAKIKKIYSTNKNIKSITTKLNTNI